MATHQIGPIVIGCLTAGSVAALALVLGPVAGAQEHVITGTVLLAFAAGWALLAALSTLWIKQPQRWAAVPAAYMASAGAGLIAFAPNDSIIDRLGWVWPALLLAMIAITVIRVHRALHSRTRFWVVYPLLAAYALSAVGGGYQTVRESVERRVYRAPGELVDVGGHRLHLLCVGTGTPTVILATLSTNSSHRVVPYTHDALITDQTAAQTSSQAIRDVVHAVRFVTSLNKS